MAKELTQRSIAFRLHGSPEDREMVRLGEFMEFLVQLKSCLNKVDSSLSRSDSPSVYYRITDLSADSASMTLEAVPLDLQRDYTVEILETVEGALNLIQERGESPEGFDQEILEAFKRLTAPLKRHVRKIDVIRPTRTTTITMQLAVSIDRILGQDITARGSLSGRLDSVNVHNILQFHIYPVIGPTKILCIFPDSLLPDVRKAIRNNVNVTGILRYKRRETFPYRIDVEEIEIYPPPQDLPTLQSIRGMAPNATGHLDSVAFIRRLRDASEA